MPAHCHKLVPMNIWPLMLLGCETPTTNHQPHQVKCQTQHGYVYCIRGAEIVSWWRRQQYEVQPCSTMEILTLFVANSPITLVPLPGCCSTSYWTCICLSHYHNKPLNGQGRWGTRNDIATSSLYMALFSIGLWVWVNSEPVYSLMLSSHLFLCPPCLLLQSDL